MTPYKQFNYELNRVTDFMSGPIQSSTGHITDVVFSGKRQLFFFGMSTGVIFASELGLSKQKIWGTHLSGVEYLHLVPGKDEDEDDSLISFGYDGSIMIWNIGQHDLGLIKILDGFHSVFKPCIVACRPKSADSSRSEAKKAHHFLVFVTDDGTLNWWDLNDHTSYATLIDGLHAITAIDVDEEDDLIAVGTASGQVRVWRLSTQAYTLQASVEGIVTKVRFLPRKTRANSTDRMLAITTSYEENLTLWRFDTTKQIVKPLDEWKIDYDDGLVFDIYPLNDDSVLVVFTNGLFKILEIDTHKHKNLADIPLQSAWSDKTDGLICATLVLVSDGKILLCRARQSGDFSVGPGFPARYWHYSPDAPQGRLGRCPRLTWASPIPTPWLVELQDSKNIILLLKSLQRNRGTQSQYKLLLQYHPKNSLTALRKYLKTAPPKRRKSNAITFGFHQRIHQECHTVYFGFLNPPLVHPRPLPETESTIRPFAPLLLETESTIRPSAPLLLETDHIAYPSVYREPTPVVLATPPPYPQINDLVLTTAPPDPEVTHPGAGSNTHPESAMPATAEKRKEFATELAYELSWNIFIAEHEQRAKKSVAELDSKINELSEALDTLAATEPDNYIEDELPLSPQNKSEQAFRLRTAEIQTKENELQQAENNGHEVEINRLKDEVIKAKLAAKKAEIVVKDARLASAKKAKNKIPDQIKRMEFGVKKANHEKKLLEAQDQLATFWQDIPIEKSMDTIAVGISEDGEIMIAGNVKEHPLVKGNGKESRFGLDEERQKRIRDVCESHSETKNTTIRIIWIESMPQNTKDNGNPHAEMQIIKFCEDHEKKIQVMGISKPACERCSDVLSANVVSHAHEKLVGGLPEKEIAKAKVGNWHHPKDLQVTDTFVFRKPDEGDERAPEHDAEEKGTVGKHLGQNHLEGVQLVEEALTPPARKEEGYQGAHQPEEQARPIMFAGIVVPDKYIRHLKEQGLGNKLVHLDEYVNQVIGNHPEEAQLVEEAPKPPAHTEEGYQGAHQPKEQARPIMFAGIVVPDKYIRHLKEQGLGNKLVHLDEYVNQVIGNHPEEAQLVEEAPKPPAHTEEGYQGAHQPKEQARPIMFAGMVVPDKYIRHLKEQGLGNKLAHLDEYVNQVVGSHPEEKHENRVTHEVLKPSVDESHLLRNHPREEAMNRETYEVPTPSEDEAHLPRNYPEIEKETPERLGSGPEGRIYEGHQVRSGRARNFTERVKQACMPRVTKPHFSPGEGRVKRAAKSLVHRNRPLTQGGIGAAIENVVDNIDRQPYAIADKTFAETGTYTNRMTAGAYAQAGVGRASAGVSFLQADALGPNVAVGAQVGMLSGVAVYAHAEVAKASISGAGCELGVGLQFDSGASIGPDGVSAEALGFGFAIGDKLEVDLPVGDVKCTVM
ncbi:hypothetical protein PT974_01901 [Cladobotryum mycophilum]|uniref:Uncharacterized protein n=1 Tax=Cladobotryum mycophilum TaxID=491253 RepID=A0ABR0SWV5_9HYPO